MIRQKRFISILLSLVMLFGTFNLTVFGATDVHSVLIGGSLGGTSILFNGDPGWPLDQANFTSETALELSVTLPYGSTSDAALVLTTSSALDIKYARFNSDNDFTEDSQLTQHYGSASATDMVRDLKSGDVIWVKATPDDTLAPVPYSTNVHSHYYKIAVTFAGAPVPTPTPTPPGSYGSSGGGGGSSSSSPAATIPASSKTLNELISDAISQGKQVNIVLDERATGIDLSAETFKRIVDSGLPLTITQGNISLTIDAETLKSLQNENQNATIRISMAPLSDANMEQLLKNFARMGLDIKTLARILDIKIIVDGKEITSFARPLTIAINMNNSKPPVDRRRFLTGIRIHADGSINKLGGNFDDRTGIFRFSTDRLSLYSVIVAEDLLSVTMTLNSNIYTKNGHKRWLDVAPTIVSDRTMVPLRVIAEALDAEVSWEDASKTATVSLGGETLALKIDEALPGMDVPAQIVNNRTMVPLRFISEYFEANVVYNERARTVEIYK